MAKTKIDLRPFKRLIDEMPKQAAIQNNRVIAAVIRQKMLDLISKGISTIQGNGRFPAYKATNTKENKYPNTVRKKFTTKRRRPVNLKLSGKFLNQLHAIPTSLYKITVGFFSDYGKKLEEGHRTGANGQGVRPIIPTEGEEFAASILLAAKKEWQTALAEYLKKNANR